MLKKKVEVIMLQTPQKTRIQKFGASLRDNKNPLLPHVREILGYYQELYFVDDSPIKSGDCFIMNGCILRQCKSTNNEPFTIPTIIDTIDGIHHVSVCKKVISCTDKSLKLNDLGSSILNHKRYGLNWENHVRNLPQPSDSFIDSYIKAFNEGNPIKFVMVDWEEKGYWMNLESHSMAVKPEWINTHDELKVDKNNTITITRCKENYSAEEVNKILDSFAERFVANTDMAYKQKDIADWKTQNL